MANRWRSALTVKRKTISSSGWITVRRSRAERINATHHPVLDYVGGKISPEMETPKLLWLKENHREVYDRAAIFDLADFLTARDRRCHPFHLYRNL